MSNYGKSNLKCPHCNKLYSTVVTYDDISIKLDTLKHKVQGIMEKWLQDRSYWVKGPEYIPVEIPTTKDTPIKISLQELAIMARNEVELEDISVISHDHRVEIPTYPAGAYRSPLPLVKDDVILARIQKNP
jgi:hypothetical protein